MRRWHYRGRRGWFVRGAREKLAEPESDTLFFAGEAASVDGQGATVHGAIASGRRAADLARG